MTKKAVIYARVSTEDQTDNYSLQTQVEACREYAKANDYEVIDEYVDSYSGTLFDRPQFNKIKKLAGKVDAVIIYDPDRLSRDAVDMANFNREFNSKGTEVRFVNFSIDTSTSLGQAFLFFQGIHAQEENTKRVERSERGMRARARSGKVSITRTAPYGYDYDPNTGTLTINEEESEIVRLIYQWYISGDENGKKLGQRSIADKLSNMGILTKNDSEGYAKRKRNKGVWGRTSVARILTAETYCGTWYYNRRKATSKTTRVWKDKDDWIAVKVPAIVSREVWEEAQRQRGHNRIHSKRNTKHQYLMQGRLVCGKCGDSFYCEADYRRHEEGLGYYRCRGQRKQYSADGKTKTCSRLIKQDVIDDLIWEYIANLLKQSELIFQALESKRGVVNDEIEEARTYLEACEKNLETLERQEKRILDLYVDEKIVKDLLDEKLTETSRKREMFEAKRQDYIERITAVELTEYHTEQMKTFCELAIEGIDHFTFEDKRMVLELLNIVGVVHRGETAEKDKIMLTGYLPQPNPIDGIDATMQKHYDGNSASRIEDTTQAHYDCLPPQFRAHASHVLAL